MAELKHLFPPNTASSERYKYGGPNAPVEFRTPVRDRKLHGANLVQEISAAESDASRESQDLPAEEKPKGITLDFVSDPGFKLQLQGLEMRRSGVELRNSRTDGDVMHATVFVPEQKVALFVKRFENYTTQNNKSGKPKNQQLVESIGAIRLATLASFWTDAGKFPEGGEQQNWEIWLREATNPHDVDDVFRERAEAAGITVSPNTIVFPERRVVLARGTVDQLLNIANLFDLLAEIRLARVLASEFLQLQSSDQSEFVAEAAGRVVSPGNNAPSVCHLDTGVNIGHPLLGVAARDEHILSVDPSWISADRHGHGTEMAGLALYGCLTEILSNTGPCKLTHCIESVKIIRTDISNDPELYGELTSQAVSRIEIAAPNRSSRVFCLTITTVDGRDEGPPSSWSAAVDQICAGVEENQVVSRRLFIVSAGNLEMQQRHEYPDRNLVTGIKDPAHSWNALTVGAFTDKSAIVEPTYAGWQVIGKPGGLSPASCTSYVWNDRTWPIKPDIVMEGGNNAIDPSTNRADNVDDLSLLTTRVDLTGPVLTTTGDTSGAAALAARYAAIISSRYPNLWPETVRGILVHSASWTEQMLEQIPGNKVRDHENRLRCFGYGVPSLNRALSSLKNSATIIVQDSIQPFFEEEKTDIYGKVSKRISTNEMHVHILPWPVQVLQGLGEVEVRMRVTLSFFIEPSPGRRGWTRKHRYQSHGLLFDVKRPTETTSDLLKRISDAAREDDEDISFGADSRNWALGDRLRRRGSIHSDTWAGTAAELAASEAIAVYPLTGWWKERAFLGRWNRQARYSLIVTLETDAESVDLYTPIANQIAIATEA
jgi:hypothetical protein